MNPLSHHIQRTRRNFFTTSASGLGAIALGSMLSEDGVLQADTVGGSPTGVIDPMMVREPHYEPTAKACIFFHMAGAPSQMDLFDPKPKLNELHGKPLPQSIWEKARFAFIEPATATLMGSPRKFIPHGQCGMELSDLLPHLGSCADDLLLVRSMHSNEFNHHPGQLLLHCGVSRFGMPTMGSWITYGLGSESRNLPGYVVLAAGRGSSGGATLHQSGFLPSSYAGVLFRNTGEPVLNLSNPKGLSLQAQRDGLDVLRDLNQQRYHQVHDPEIASRIASYELASRMQLAAPELLDLSNETQATLDMYGVGRPEPEGGQFRGSLPHLKTYDAFARNCLLARRMVERGVRFVLIVHASWDQHSDLDREIAYNAGVVDQPIAALIKDLKRRGMLDSTLVGWGSEFGRTPLAENGGDSPNTGRDHHPICYSTLLAGGGLQGGQVYGESDEIGWDIARDPVHANDLHATMLRLFGVDHLRLTYRFQGRDFRLTDVAGKVMKPWLRGLG